MTPEVLADIHAAAFDRPWSAATFTDLCGQTGVFALGSHAGFILVRAVVDEAEILTLAVRPEARRRGVGADLVHAATRSARARGAERLYLEVAEDNAAALALYRSAGFAQEGRRKGYYPRRDRASAAALILSLKLAD